LPIAILPINDPGSDAAAPIFEMPGMSRFNQSVVRLRKRLRFP
jgi:hypothetical protein